MLRKLVSLITLGCFVLTTVAPSASAAAERRPEAQLPESLATPLLPSAAGRVTESMDFGSETVVVNIQDLHCHPEVQRNIRTILSHLDHNYGLSRVHLEGAHGKVDVSWLDFAGGRELRERAIERLVDTGELTGAEYCAVLEGMNGRLFGLENRELHARNVVALSRLMGEQEKIGGILSLLEKDVRALKTRYYTRAHRLLDEALARHRKGTLSARKYYRFLRKHAEEAGIDLRLYRNVASFLGLIELERSLQYGKAAREMQELMLLLKRQLPYREYAALVEEAGNGRLTDGFYLRLADAAGRCGINTAPRLRHLHRFFAYLRLSRSVNPVDLVREENRLRYDVSSRLSETKGERDVVLLAYLLELLGDCFTNRISYQDYLFLTQNIDGFHFLWVKYTGNEKSRALIPYDQMFRPYYEANIARNGWFIRNVLGGGFPPAPAVVRPGPGGPVASLKGKRLLAVVTGGFHTPGLTELLRRRNVSYVVVTPNVTQDTRFAEEAYSGLIREQGSFLSESLRGLDLSQVPLHVQADKAARALLPVLMERESSPAAVGAAMNEALASLAPGGPKISFRIVQWDGKGNCEYVLRSGNHDARFAYASADGPTAGLGVSSGRRDAPPLSPELTASVFGVEYAGLAPYFELVYAFPYANRLLKGFLAKTFPALAARVGESETSRTADGIISLVLFGAAAAGILSGGLPLAVLSTAAYAAARGYAFSAAHARATPRQKKILAAAGGLFAASFALPFLFVSPLAAPPLPQVFGAFAAGAWLNVALHSLYNYAVLAGWLPAAFPPAAIDPGLGQDELAGDIEQLLEQLHGADIDKDEAAKRELGRLGVRATPYLLSLLDAAEDDEALEKARDALLVSADLSAIPELQKMYLRSSSRDRRGAIAFILKEFMTSCAYIETPSPRETEQGNRSTILKTTYPNRLAAALPYIERLVREEGIRTIVDCSASDGSSSLTVMQAAQSLDGGIEFIAMDLNMLLYRVTAADGTVALFDAQDKPVWLFASEGTWVRGLGEWRKNGTTVGPPGEELLAKCRELLRENKRRISKDIEIGPEGVRYADYAVPGGRITRIPLIDPSVIEYAMRHRGVSFLQGDFFRLGELLPGKKVDIAIVANVLGYRWNYYNRSSTIEALRRIGQTLGEGGKLIVGNNPRVGLASEFRFHVYERRDGKLILRPGDERPGVWEGEVVTAIDLADDEGGVEAEVRNLATNEVRRERHGAGTIGVRRGEMATATAGPGADVTLAAQGSEGEIIVAAAAIDRDGRHELILARVPEQDARRHYGLFADAVRGLMTRGMGNIKVFLLQRAQSEEGRRFIGHLEGIFGIYPPFEQVSLDRGESADVSFTPAELILRRSSDGSKPARHCVVHLKIGDFFVVPHGRPAPNHIVLPPAKRRTPERRWLEEQYSPSYIDEDDVFVHRATAGMMKAMQELDRRDGFRGRSLLDVGSGNGILSVLAEKLGARTVTAVDIDAGILEYSRKIAALNGAENIEFLLADARTLRVPGVDVVLANVGGEDSREIIEAALERHPETRYLIASGPNIQYPDSPVAREARAFFRSLGKIVYTSHEGGIIPFEERPHEMYPIHLIRLKGTVAREKGPAHEIAYIRHLAQRRGALAGAEEALARQPLLLAFAENIADRLSPAEPHSRLHKRLATPFALYVFDRDGTITADRQPLTREFALLLEQLQARVPGAQVAVISGASMESLREKVARRVPGVKLWLYGEGGGQGFDPDGRHVFSQPLTETRGEYEGLAATVLRVLADAGVDADRIEFQKKSSELTVGIKGSSYGSRNPLADVLRSALPGYTIANTSVCLEVLRAGKGEALEDLARRIGEQRGMPPGDVLRNTLVCGDSENDIPMLNLAAEKGGLAVFVGEPHESLSPGVVVASRRGPEGTFAILDSHRRFLEEEHRSVEGVRSRIDGILRDVRDDYFGQLEKEFGRELKYRDGFRICGEASYILARAFSNVLRLPVYGTAPDRIEISFGAVLDEYGRPYLHRWVTVYIGGRKALLIDPTYRQFDEKYANAFLAGDYDTVAGRHRYVEWDDLLALELKKHREAGWRGTDDEIIGKVRKRYEELRQENYGAMPPILLIVHDNRDRIRNMLDGRDSGSEFGSAAVRDRMDAVARELLERHPRVQAAPFALIAGFTARRAYAPLAAARDISRTAASIAARERPDGSGERTMVSVAWRLGERGVERLLEAGRQGITPIGITAGAPARGTFLCSVPTIVPGRDRPLNVRVWAEKKERNGASAVLLSLDSGSPEKGLLAAKTFGRAVLALLERLVEDPVVQSDLRDAGAAFGRFLPDIVELNGERSVFAIPSLVDDGYREKFGSTVFAFIPEAAGESPLAASRTPAEEPGMDGEYFREAAGDGRFDLVRAGLLAADVTIASGRVTKRYPWLTAGTAHYVAEDDENPAAALVRHLRLYQAASLSRAGHSVARRRAPLVITTSVAQVQPLSLRERGTFTDFRAHIDGMNALQVGAIHLRDLFGRDPFLVNTHLIDVDDLPGGGERRSIAGAYHDVMAGEGEEVRDDFRRFAREYAAQLGGRADEDAFAQFAARAQLRKTLDHAHRKERRVFFEYRLERGAEPEAAMRTLIYWVRFGFDGMKLDLTSLEEPPEALLSAVAGEIHAVNPGAEIVIAPPRGTDEGTLERMKEQGIVVALSVAPGERVPAAADEKTWLELSFEEGRLLDDAGEVKSWLNGLMGSDTLYVAVPDALRWGGSIAEGAGFRNPSKAEQRFDLTEDIAAMVLERMGVPRTMKLHRWEYRDGYRDALAVPLPPAKDIDWAGLASFRRVSVGSGVPPAVQARGLHPLLAVLDRLRADAAAAERVFGSGLPGSTAEMFGFARRVLSETPGLRAHEWDAGWHYIENLEKKARGTSSPDRRAGYALQMLEFMGGITERLLEERYAMRRGWSLSRLPKEEKDRAAFRAFLLLADASSGIDAFDGRHRGEGIPGEAARILSRDGGIEGSPWAELARTLDGNGAGKVNGRLLETLRNELSGNRAGLPLHALKTALYLKALTAVTDDTRTGEEIRSSLRRILYPLARQARGASPGSSFVSGDGMSAAVRWALSELLAAFDAFSDIDAGPVDVEELLDGAISPLGVARIRSAA